MHSGNASTCGVRPGVPLMPCQSEHAVTAAAALLRVLCVDAAADTPRALHSPVTQLLSWRHTRGDLPASTGTRRGSHVTLHELLGAQASFCRDTELGLCEKDAAAVQPAAPSVPVDGTSTSAVALQKLRSALQRTRLHRSFVCSAYNAVPAAQLVQDDTMCYRSPWSGHVQRPLTRLPCAEAGRTAAAAADDASCLRAPREGAALRFEATMPVPHTSQPPHSELAARLEHALNEALARYMEAYAVGMPLRTSAPCQTGAAQERSNEAAGELCNAAATAYVTELAAPCTPASSGSCDDTQASASLAAALAMTVVVLTYRQQQRRQEEESDEMPRPRLVCGHSFACRLLDSIMTVSHECTTLLLLRRDEDGGMLRYYDCHRRGSDTVSLGTSSTVSAAPPVVSALRIDRVTDELLRRVEAAEDEVGLRLQPRIEPAFSRLAECI